MIYTTDILGDQWEIFFGSLMLGVLLGFCYDFIRAAKIIFSFGKKAAIAADVIYSVWAGFLVFSFLLEKNFGIPRAYIYIGVLLGFLTWYLTLGKLTLRLSKFVKRILSTIKRKFFVPVLKFLGKIFELCKRKSKVLENILAKKLSTGNKLLKKKGRLVYNNLYLSKKKALPICGGKAGKEPGSFESEGTEEKEKSFDQGRSYCLRSISPLFDDNNAGEHSRKEG